MMYLLGQAARSNRQGTRKLTGLKYLICSLFSVDLEHDSRSTSLPSPISSLRNTSAPPVLNNCTRDKRTRAQITSTHEMASTVVTSKRMAPGWGCLSKSGSRGADCAHTDALHQSVQHKNHARLESLVTYYPPIHKSQGASLRNEGGPVHITRCLPLRANAGWPVFWLYHPLPDHGRPE